MKKKCDPLSEFCAEDDKGELFYSSDFGQIKITPEFRKAIDGSISRTPTGRVKKSARPDVERLENDINVAARLFWVGGKILKEL